MLSLSTKSADWQPTLHIVKTNVNNHSKWYIWGTNGPTRFTIQMLLNLDKPDTWFTPPSINFDDSGKTSILIPANQPIAFFRGRIVRTR